MNPGITADVEIHPQDVRGFVDLTTHPWICAICESVLGPHYEMVCRVVDKLLPVTQKHAIEGLVARAQ